MKKSPASSISVFIAAPAKVDLRILRSELEKRGLQVFTPYDLAPATISITENVQRAITGANLVIAVVSEDPSPNIFFELGMAHALRKPFILLVSPKCRTIPSNLAGAFYLRTDADNADAIGFALDQFLARLKDTTAKPGKPQIEERPLGNETDRFLSRLAEQPGITGRRLENFVAQVLRTAGVTAVTERDTLDSGVDLAVWSDALQPIAGNPLLIEVKGNIRDNHQLLAAVTQVERFRETVGSRLALLVAKKMPPSPAFPFAGGVLTVTLSDLLSSLRTKTFADTVRELRNQYVHGRRM